MDPWSRPRHRSGVGIPGVWNWRGRVEKVTDDAGRPREVRGRSLISAGSSSRKSENEGGRWYYDFMIKRMRYRRVVPEARTKWEAEQAETQIRLSVFENRYGRDDGKADFSSFVEETYLPWAKLNKRSWNDDRLIAGVLCDFVAGKTFSQITPMLVEKFKKERRESMTKRETLRRPATVNRELAVPSRICTLAADAGVATSNPCLRVKQLRQDNSRTRYLLPDEEARLMAVLESRPLLRGDAGAGLKTIAEILGHSTVQMSAGETHATDEAKR